jgi:ubiquinone/menaquinone biosynthesis C-methylase UbiE
VDQITALDLNPVSVAQTTARFKLFGLSGDIREADAEALPLSDRQFAFARKHCQVNIHYKLMISLNEFDILRTMCYNLYGSFSKQT